MRIYVAAKFEDAPRAQEIAQQLTAAGHTITHEWWNNTQVTAAEAQADVDGALSADALVLIVEKDLRYNGALVELGLCIARGIPIYVLGHAIDHNIFLQLPQIIRGIESLL